MRFNRPNLFQKLLTGLLVLFLIVAPSLTVVAPKKAEAQMSVLNVGGVGDIAEIATVAYNAIIAGNSSSLVWKEMVLDPLLWTLAKMVVQQIVQSTIAWVNSGFKGAPMFVTNPGKFLGSIADQIAGQMISGTDLAFLCQPINIRIALNLSYTHSTSGQVAACTLTGIVGNVQGFLNGNFLAGGWPGWLSMAIQPSNNAFGAEFNAEMMLAQRIAGQQNLAQQKLSWGKGFLSKEVCDTDGDGNQNCHIVTPGTTVADATTFHLQAGEVTLIQADEFNELISALLGQLFQQALTGAQGLMGASSQTGTAYTGYFDTGNGGTSQQTQTYCASLTYLQQMSDPQCNGSQTDTTGSTVASAISQAVTDEQAFQTIWQSPAGHAQQIINQVNAEGTCGNNAQILTDVTNSRNSSDALIAQSQQTVAELDALQAQYDAATTVQARNAAVAAIESYLSSHTFHNGATNAQSQSDANNTNASLNTSQSQITDCAATQPTGTTIDTNQSGVGAFIDPNAGLALFNESVDFTDASGGVAPVNGGGLQSILSAAGTQCTALMDGLAGTARNGALEQGYVFFRDRNGNYRMGNITQSSSAGGVQYDTGLINEAATVGQDIHILHTHPSGSLSVLGLSQKGPSDQDYLALCSSATTKNATHVVVDGGTGNVWEYKLNDPNAAQCATDRPGAQGTLECLDGLSVLRGMPTANRAQGVTNLRSALSNSTCLNGLSSTPTDADLYARMQSTANGAGIALAEKSTGAFCSTRQNGLPA